MKAIQLIKHSAPEQACACIEVPDALPPADGHINVAIKASAINPADLLMFQALYPGPTELPAFVGIEGAGIVTAVGANVEEFAVGDHVISMGRANWMETVTGAASQFVPIPKELPWHSAAQLKANPPSAHLMLTDFVALKPGDWVVQNAANSAVGRHVISFCKARGLRSINIVRRESLVHELSALGADCVVVDSDDLAEKVRQRIGTDAKVRLGIDAIGGTGTLKIGNCLSNGGTIVNYGFLSGNPCQVSPTQTVVQDITLKGFWLVGFMHRSSREQIVELYQSMAQSFISGDLNVPVEAEYPLEQINKALAHAAQESRSGKVLLIP